MRFAAAYITRIGLVAAACFLADRWSTKWIGVEPVMPARLAVGIGLAALIRFGPFWSAGVFAGIFTAQLAFGASADVAFARAGRRYDRLLDRPPAAQTLVRQPPRHRRRR